MESEVRINRPIISKKILGFYVATVIFIAALIVSFAYLAFSIAPFELIYALIVLIPIEIIMLSILISFRRTEYVLTKEDLLIRTSRLIAFTKKKRIPLAIVKSVEKTLIPLGFRLFGASFYGGYYHVPGLGRTFITMTNFNDGILLKTEEGENFIITPSNPKDFIEAVKARCFQ
ncbi:MAG: hypothetical protein GTN80_08260 [Nitrososphaeria archaeon]|nr:hypothetical protein [Nitrososphaeria archaeon]NIN53029.1 hypothetical protein [Nitrososphaeria archaeon]NIQ33616.1 hypothetical protein [Nitrososphaeria archaeon]